MPDAIGRTIASLLQPPDTTHDARPGPAPGGGATVERLDARDPLGQLLKSLFSPQGPAAGLGGAAAQAAGAEPGVVMVINSIFQFIGSLVAGGGEASAPPAPRPLDPGNPIGSSQALKTGVRSPGQALVEGRIQEGFRHEANVQGAFGDETFGGSGSAHAHVAGSVSAEGRVVTDGKSITAEGELQARIEARANARGSIHTPVGEVRGEANAYAEAFARVGGRATAGAHGIRAQAEAAAGAAAGADANAALETPKVLGMGLAARGEAEAVAGSGARASAGAGFTFKPPEFSARVGAEAFAGARAAAAYEFGLGPVNVKTSVEAWAGVGAKAEFGAELEDGKLKFGFEIGLAVGVGVSFGQEFTIDTQSVGAFVGGVTQLAGGLVDTAGKLVSQAGAAIADAGSQVFKGVPLLGDLFSFGARLVGGVVQAAGAIASGAASVVGKVGGQIAGQVMDEVAQGLGAGEDGTISSRHVTATASEETATRGDSESDEVVTTRSERERELHRTRKGDQRTTQDLRSSNTEVSRA